MAGRPDLAMERIKIAFPHHPSRIMAFGFRAVTASGHNLARGFVDRDSVLHNYHRGIDEPYKVPDCFDVNGITDPSVHGRIAKQCVAVTLFGYDPEHPGEMTDEEMRRLTDSKHGSGTYDAIRQSVDLLTISSE